MNILIYVKKSKLRPIGGPVGYCYNILQEKIVSKDGEVTFLDRALYRKTAFPFLALNRTRAAIYTNLLHKSKEFSNVKNCKYDSTHANKVDLSNYDIVHFHSTYDLYGAKFFGALAYFGELTCKDSGGGSRISQLSCLLTVFLFMLFLLDRVLNVFPSDYRYGIKATRLFFNHPTYLAGICVFLIALMTIYNVEKNLPYIGMNMIMMIFTLRSKAIVSAVLFVVLYVVIVKLHAKLKVWQMVIVGIVCIVCAWSQIYFYFVFLGGQSARSVMLFTSFKIMKDYFPIGTGFGCYASHSAAVNYSPVYIKYGFNYIYELRNAAEGTFFDDQFWPIIFGQTGVIGTAAYICILVFLFRKVQKLFKVNLKTYTAALVVFIYLLVSSTAEPAFNNAVAIPLAMVLEICYSQADQYRNAQKSVKKRGMK